MKQQLTPAYRIKVEHDLDPQSPREWENLGTMACWHRDYQLGDEQPSEDPQEYKLRLAENAEPRIALLESVDDAKVQAILDKHYIILPLYLYDRGGITMNTAGFSCRWDSGQVGFIYVPVAKIKTDYGWKVLTAKRRQKIEEVLRSEVQIYDHYLQGDVYGYVVEEQIDGQWEEIGSCCGFYGEDTDGVHCYVEQYGFTTDQVKAAFADVGNAINHTVHTHQGE